MDNVRLRRETVVEYSSAKDGNDNDSECVEDSAVYQVEVRFGRESSTVVIDELPHVVCLEIFALAYLSSPKFQFMPSAARREPRQSHRLSPKIHMIAP